MNTKHVPNLELCQELDRLCKENNITLPETEFYWVEATISGEWYLASNADNHYSPATKGFFPAPLVSEQGEWLSKNKCIIPRYSNQENYTGWFATKVNPTLNILENTEANARQKLINYLITEEIITTL